MGVPAFFGWTCRMAKAAKILLKSLKQRPQPFYIDANCFFHPECFKIPKYFLNETNIDILEDFMIRRNINFLVFLEYFVNPTDFMFMAVDGVAPDAKMKQQRSRRIRSIDDAKERKEINMKHGIGSNTVWSNIVITPGTKFMEKMHQALLDHFERSKRKGFKYIYSSYHTPGEGEHKILQHMKSMEFKNTDSIVVYGLDADLIFLSLASGFKNIYLLREEIHFGGRDKEEIDIFDPVSDVAVELMYVSMDATRDAFNTLIRKSLMQRFHKDYSDVEFSNDFIFICFFLGNDFLPHFPSLEIKTGGIEDIINVYTETYELTHKKLITFENDKVNINQVVLQMIVEKLGEYEEDYFRNVYPRHVKDMSRRKCFAHDDYSREIWNMENMRHIEIDDPIKLGVGDTESWKYRYYSHYYGASEHMQELINNMCKSYLEGVMWVSKYYFEKCIDWRWQYLYNHAPFLSDLAKYMKESDFDINDIVFKQSSNVPAMVQLMCVLPPQRSDLLPEKYKELVTSPDSDIRYMFPTAVKLDTLYKTQYYQCIPLLPPLDVEKILELTKDIKLTKDEKIRNSELEEFVYEKN